MMKNVFLVFVLTAGMTSVTVPVKAADPVPTTIFIPEMDCANCAKKVTAKLTTLPGVAKAVADMKAKTITVTPKAGAVLSPKVVWEAVEQADQDPTKLAGPSGTFTKKPQS